MSTSMTEANVKSLQIFYTQEILASLLKCILCHDGSVPFERYSSDTPKAHKQTRFYMDLFSSLGNYLGYVENVNNFS